MLNFKKNMHKNRFSLNFLTQFNVTILYNLLKYSLYLSADKFSIVYHWKVNETMIDNPVIYITQSKVDVIYFMKSNWWNASNQFTDFFFKFICWPDVNLFKVRKREIFLNYALELFRFDGNTKTNGSSTITTNIIITVFKQC